MMWSQRSWSIDAEASGAQEFSDVLVSWPRINGLTAGKLARVEGGESLRSRSTATAVIEVTKTAHTTVVRVGPRPWGSLLCPVLLKVSFQADGDDKQTIGRQAGTPSAIGQIGAQCQLVLSLALRAGLGSPKTSGSSSGT